MKKIAILLLVAAAISGCSKTQEWHLDGEAPDSVNTVYLKAPNNYGGWYILDSAIVKNGKYKFIEPRAKGQIYSVSLGETTYYVPADSTENITLSVNGERSGSDEAELFNQIEKIFASGGNGRDILLALDGKYASTAAYYATRLVKDRLLLRTVTNRYNEERPNDPHTAILRTELGKMLPKPTASGEKQVIIADEIGYYNIELMNRNGEMKKLSDVVDANPLVVLAYVDFTTEDSPAITRALGDTRTAGAEIYEVGFAENQHLWANSTEGIPWTVVYQSEAANSSHISQYAVSGLPTFFIIRNGEIVDRLTDYAQLTEIINKYK